MKRIQSYAIIAALVLFSGHAANYSPESQELALPIDTKAETIVFYDSRMSNPEPSSYVNYYEPSAEGLKEILYQAGFRNNELREAWAVVMKESTGNPMAHNDNPVTGDDSYGLFQINMIGSMGPDRRDQFGLESNEDLFNPVVNAKIAFIISDGGRDWSPWAGIGSSTLKWMNEYPE
jgi:Lysozyme like domain